VAGLELRRGHWCFHHFHVFWRAESSSRRPRVVTCPACGGCPVSQACGRSDIGGSPPGLFSQPVATSARRKRSCSKDPRRLPGHKLVGYQAPSLSLWRSFLPFLRESSRACWRTVTNLLGHQLFSSHSRQPNLASGLCPAGFGCTLADLFIRRPPQAERYR